MCCVRDVNTHVVFSLCFGFVTNIAKCFILAVFPRDSDTARRRMWEFLFCGGKSAGRFVCLKDSGNLNRLITAHFDRLLLQT